MLANEAEREIDPNQQDRNNFLENCIVEGMVVAKTKLVAVMNACETSVTARNNIATTFEEALQDHWRRDALGPDEVGLGQGTCR